MPGPKRKDLIDRFRDDPDCRLFFSTDAGGVGLNLQFASVVVNVDLPWNPAVLEQRIGRVHRLGQQQPVRVVNFVAKGTIEEGMLGVLKFKKSLFAGVLDGGEKEVILGGTPADQVHGDGRGGDGGHPGGAPRRRPRRRRKPAASWPRRRSTEADETAVRTAPAGDAWSGLLQAGMALARQLADASKAQPSADGLVRRDERTGETYLRLPVPSPEVVQQALQVVGAFLQSFQSKG